MNSFLLFTLHAPLGSFGGPAAGRQRPSDSRPGRSMVMGLLAASMGIGRNAEDDHAHRQLERSYGYAVRVDAPGKALTDFHTITTVRARRGRTYRTRRDELRRGRWERSLSERTWIAGSFHTACLWQRPGHTVGLTEASWALARPVYALYCGRKAGSLGLPPRPEILQAGGLVEAFAGRRFNPPEETVLRCLAPTRPGDVWIAFDLDAPGAPDTFWAETRRDQSVSRSRRQYAEREEGFLVMGAEAA